jgi:hypothetical protein
MKRNISPFEGEPLPASISQWIHDTVEQAVRETTPDVPMDLLLELEDEVRSLPSRFDPRLTVSLGMISALSVQISEARASLQDIVDGARAWGATWEQVGIAAGITAVAAQRRWDPIARTKHAEYQKKRRAQMPKSSDE